MKIKLTKEQTSFLNESCTIINTPKGDVYMYLPFWYKKTDMDNVFEELSFDKLPSDFKKELNERRNPNNIPDFDLNKTYFIGDNVKYGDSVWVFRPKGKQYPSSIGIYPGTGNGWKIKKS